jgi:hypothetical protein
VVPVGTGLAAGVAKRLGIRLPPGVLRLMRFGRGPDNRRIKAASFRFRHTTRETIQRLGEHQRVEPILRALHEHEAAHRARQTVLAAIERLQPWEPGR